MLNTNRKTVMKGSAGKIVERDTLPENPLIPSTIKKVKELHDQGKSALTISIAIGKSTKWVKESLLIIKRLPEKVHTALANNKLSRTTALQLLMVKPEKLDNIVNAMLTLCETEGKL